MGQLSGGEKVRLALGKMLQTRPNLLILDEPTNHMDIIGKEALEQMLHEYEGTVLFVSHDRYFISRIATGILEFSGDAVRQYAMNYEEYLAEKQKCAGGVAANAGSAAGQGADVRGAADAGSVPTLSDVFDRKAYYNPGKVRSRLQRQKEKYERMLAESEEKLAELQMQMLDPALASDYPKLMELQSAVDAEEANQDSLLERMLETETELAEYEEA
jgi:ABC transporter, ATP-binding protein